MARKTRECSNEPMVDSNEEREEDNKAKKGSVEGREKHKQGYEQGGTQMDKWRCWVMPTLRRWPGCVEALLCSASFVSF
jgi:hypothetical protein